MKEIVTLQLGSQASWVGAHYWNVQDDTLHPQLDADGQPLLEPEHADPRVLYRSGQDERSEATLRPRLVVCDESAGFGTLSAHGRRPNALQELREHAESWRGAVHVEEHEPREQNAFLRMLQAPTVAGVDHGASLWGAPKPDAHALAGEEGDCDPSADEAADQAADDECGDGGVGGEGGGRRRSRGAGDVSSTPSAHQRGGGDHPPMSAASFHFEETVEHWSDYLQA